MPGPARAGALIYAKDLPRLSAFYRQLLGMALRAQDDQHHVIESADAQLIIHAIPPAIAATFEIATPPVLREEQAVKLFFTVPDLAAAEVLAAQLGGGITGPVYDGPGFRARNGFDPEGNLFHLRADTAGRPADRFDHLFIEPSSFDAAVAFYRDGLGWEPMFSWGGPGEPRGIGLSGGGTRLVLAERHAAADHSKTHGIEGHRPTLHLVVDDLDERHRVLAAQGLALFAPETTHWGTRWFVVRDPDGNLVAFEQARPAAA